MDPTSVEPWGKSAAILRLSRLSSSATPSFIPHFAALDHPPTLRQMAIPTDHRCQEDPLETGGGYAAIAHMPTRSI